MHIRTKCIKDKIEILSFNSRKQATVPITRCGDCLQESIVSFTNT